MSFVGSVALISAATGAAVAPIPGVDIAAIGAIEFCAIASHQAKITIPSEYIPYRDPETSDLLASMHVPSRTMADAPPLVRRFAATSPAARLGRVVEYLEVPANNGAVWIVLGYGGLNACDVMVTGVEQVAEIQDSIFGGISSNSKWTLFHSTKGDATTPIRAAIFSQSAPKARKPGFGIRLKVQALRSDFAKPDGVQLAASVVSGNLTITPTELNVSP